MNRDFVLNGNLLQVRIEPAADGVTLVLNGKTHELAVQEFSPGRLVIRGAGGQCSARVVRDRDKICVWLDGKTLVFQIPSAEHDGQGGHGKIDRELRAPMPGTLVKLLVAPGDAVEEGQVLAVVEAMKMEHPLRAPRAGIIEAVAGAVGTIVDADLVIVSLQEGD
jgi:acetyl/propionyl-CoA carboxylase alpha subunit